MIINGKELAQNLFIDLAHRVAHLNFAPIFCDIIVGSDPVSLSYVNIKGKKAQEIGLAFQIAQFPETINTEELVLEIQKLNQVENMCGLIVQLPLPEHLDRRKVLDAINPKLDVDVLSSKNSDDFYSGNSLLVPPTAAAVLYLLDSLNQDLSQKNILVIGQGDLVGRPVVQLLKERKINASIADSKTNDLRESTKLVDVIISGTGKAGLITGDIIKPGSIIIDAGTAESGSGIVGDVDFESVSNLASFVSPVPGGVGPVTVAKLLENVVTVAEGR